MGRTWLVGLGSGNPPVALIYPGPKRVGFENLGLHAAFRGLNRQTFVDLFFTDEPRGLRSGKPLREFPVVFFSFSYEPDYPVALKFLLEQGIEVDRRLRRRRPLLLAGGIAPSANPLPLYHSFDAVLVGEAEAIFSELDISTLTPDEVFDSLLSKPWAFVPEEKEAAQRAWLPDLSETDAYSALLEEESFFKGQFGVEIVRGCPTRCRFCLLGFFRLPPRFLGTELLLDLLSQIPKGLVQRAGLVGSAIAEHPGILQVLREAPPYLQIVPTSLNVRVLTREIVEGFARRGLKTLTVAPEAATERLRYSLNKGFDNEKLFQVIAWAAEAGYGSVKLYYMLGLPGEEDEDVAEINSQVSEVKRLFKRRVRVTVSPFIPKPHTPFYKKPFLTEKDYKRKAKLIGHPPEVLLKVHGYRKAREEAVLSRGDEAVSRALILAAKEGGSVINALRRLGVPPAKYLDDPGYLENAPYLVVHSGVSEKFLNLEERRAAQGKLTPPCNPERCRMCGLC